VVEPLPPLVTLRQLETFFPPKPLHALVIDVPALDSQELGDLAIPVSSVLLGQTDQSQPKAVFIFWGSSVLMSGP